MLGYSLLFFWELKLEKKNFSGKKNLRQDWQLYPLKCFFFQKIFLYFFVVFYIFLPNLGNSFTEKGWKVFHPQTISYAFIFIFLSLTHTQAPDIIISQSFLHFSNLQFIFSSFYVPLSFLFYHVTLLKVNTQHIHLLPIFLSLYLSLSHTHIFTVSLSLSHTHTLCYTHLLSHSLTLSSSFTHTHTLVFAKGTLSLKRQTYGAYLHQEEKKPTHFEDIPQQSLLTRLSSHFSQLERKERQRRLCVCMCESSCSNCCCSHSKLRC